MRLMLIIATLAASLGVWGIGGSTARAAPPLAAYGKLPALELVRLSPSGDKIAFVAVDGEARRLFVRQVGGDALIVNPIGTGKVRGLKWVGDDYLLILASGTARFGPVREHLWGEPGKYELFIALVVNMKTHNIIKMFDHKALEILDESIYADFRSVKLDGRWYEYVGANSMTDRGIYKVDLETGKYTIIPTYHVRDYRYYIGEQGTIAAVDWYDEVHKRWSLFAGDGDHGDHVVMNRVSPLFTVSAAGAGRTPGTVLVTDNDGALDTWEEYALTPGAPATPLFAGVQVQELLHDPTSDLLIGAVLSGGQTAQFFDPKLQHRFDAARKAFANYQIALESYSTDLKRMVIKTDGADDSGTYWLIDMATGKAEDLMGAYPAIEPKDVGPTRMFAYKSADGLALEGVLTLPPGSDGKGLPLVVMPHGGPFDVNDVVGFDWWAQAFAGRGYAVFQPNYRGSSGYGIAFRDKGYGEWGRGMLSDMSDGVAALAKAGIVDPRRACIVGASYGGYAALAGVTIQHGLYRCAVSVSGVSDVGAVMNTADYNDETAAGRINQQRYGAKTPFDRAITDISPVRHAGAADAPILMIHGQDDTRVPLVHSLSMRDALQRAHKTVELVITPGEDHFLSREATRVQTLEASVGWVEKYNPAGPAGK